MFKKYRKKILISAVLGAIIFLVFSIYADFDKLISAFGRFNWLWFPFILFLSFLNYITRYFKWEFYLRELGIHIPLKKSILIFFSAFVMSVTPGKMGEVLKSFLLKEETGIPVSKSAPIVLAERITDFLSIIFLCMIGALVFDYGKMIIILTGLVFIALIAVISNRKLSLGIISFFEKLKFVSKHIIKIHTAYDSIYQLIKFKPLFIAFLLSIFAWSFECIGFYVVLKIFSSETNIQISILTATFIYGFSTLIGAIVMLPGGLGVTEASLTGLLILLNIPKNISVASTIIIRIATLWFAVLIGIIAVLLYQHSMHKSFDDIIADENKI